MELGVRTIGVLLRLLYVLTAPLYWLAARRRARPPPPPPLPLLRGGVSDHADNIRNGKITSTALTTAYIQRIREVNPHLNAVSDERYGAALEEAEAADREIRQATANGTLDDLVKRKPLIGIPFTVKESCKLNGMSCSTGHMDYVGRRAASDGAAAGRLRAAGGIPLAVTSTPELCLGWETTNLLRGATNNPYSLTRTAGGSSGGEAALIASGASPFGLASDIAGSIRLPSAFCGLFGLKPTPGIIPIEGHIPTLEDEDFPKYLCFGPITRKAEDLSLLLNIMAGDDARKLNLDTPVQIKDIKVHYLTELTFSPALQDVAGCVKRAVRAAAGHLRDHCGATIVQPKFEHLEDAVEISLSQFFSMRNMPNLLQDPANPKRDKSLLMEFIKCFLGGGARTLQGLCFTLMFKTNLFIPQARVPHYRRKAKALLQEFKSILGDDGVLLLPVHNGPAHHHNQVYVTVSGVPYTMIFNILGMPAAVVPMGLHDGLPVAIQVVAAPHQDRLCLAVARQLQDGFGGWRPPG